MNLKKLPGYIRHIETKDGNWAKIVISVKGKFEITLQGLLSDTDVRISIDKKIDVVEGPSYIATERMFEFFCQKRELDNTLDAVVLMLWMMEKLIREGRLNGEDEHYTFTKPLEECRYFWKRDNFFKEIGLYYAGISGSTRRVLGLGYEKREDTIYELTIKTGVKTIWEGNKYNIKKINNALERYFPVGSEISLDSSFRGWTEGTRGEIGYTKWEIKPYRIDSNVLCLFISPSRSEEGWLVDYFYGSQDIFNSLKPTLGAIAIYDWLIRVLGRITGYKFHLGFRNHNFRDVLELTLTNSRYSVDYGEIVVHIKRDLNEFSVTVESGIKSCVIGNKRIVVDPENIRESKETLIKMLNI